MTDFKKIILCADDFGLNSGISEGLLKLIGMRRLSAVSCMVNSPDFAVYAQELRRLAGQVQIGLHFNLTESRLLSNPGRQGFSLPSLLLKTHLRSISAALIEQEFLAQLNYFIKSMGRAPDFIDGHQHVHQFPVIRTTLLKLYAERLKATNAYIRLTYPMISLPPFRFKTAVLAHTGGKGLNRAVKQLGLAHNQCFAGIYDFSPKADYRALFQQWLSLAPENTLIMCHPAEGIDANDVIAHARLNEMAYFSSDAFLADCAARDIVLI